MGLWLLVLFLPVAYVLTSVPHPSPQLIVLCVVLVGCLRGFVRPILLGLATLILVVALLSSPDPKNVRTVRIQTDLQQPAETDDAAARRSYLDAASRGDPVAQTNLAILLSAGRGGPVDIAGAFQWYLRAARQGSPRGLNGVGYSYLTGRGVGRDVDRAALWLRAAAEAGQPNAMHSLASLYLQGAAVPASPLMAYYWLSLAVRNYPTDDEKRPAARAALEQAVALLDDEQRSMIDEDVRSWKSQPGRPPE